MNWIILATLFVAITGLFLFMALPRSRWKIQATLCYLVMGFSCVGAVSEILGQSKPIEFEWRNMKSVSMIHYFLVEDEAIYLWRLINGEPRSYRLPWKTTDAEKVQGSAEQEGTILLDLSGDDHGIEAKVQQPKPLPPKE